MEDIPNNVLYKILKYAIAFSDIMTVCRQWYIITEPIFKKWKFLVATPMYLPEDPWTQPVETVWLLNSAALVYVDRMNVFQWLMKEPTKITRLLLTVGTLNSIASNSGIWKYWINEIGLLSHRNFDVVIGKTHCKRDQVQLCTEKCTIRTVIRSIIECNKDVPVPRILQRVILDYVAIQKERRAAADILGILEDLVFGTIGYHEVLRYVLQIKGLNVRNIWDFILYREGGVGIGMFHWARQKSHPRYYEGVSDETRDVLRQYLGDVKSFVLGTNPKK